MIKFLPIHNYRNIMVLNKFFHQLLLGKFLLLVDCTEKQNWKFVDLSPIAEFNVDVFLSEFLDKYQECAQEICTLVLPPVAPKMVDNVMFACLNLKRLIGKLLIIMTPSSSRYIGTQRIGYCLECP